MNAPEHTRASRQGRRVAMIETGRGKQRAAITIPNEPPTRLGKRLRDLREKSGMRQSDLAPLLNTGPNRVSDWELAVVTPSLAILSRYAQTFGMTVSQLLNGVM